MGTVTRTATRALSTSAALKKDEKMMETIDHAVGPEKYELLAKQQGNDDPFFLRVINRADFKGTKEDPIIVNALDSYRMIGCSGSGSSRAGTRGAAAGTGSGSRSTHPSASTTCQPKS